MNLSQSEEKSVLYDFESIDLKFYIVVSGWVTINTKSGNIGEYGPGTIIGEEWLQNNKFSGRKNQVRLSRSKITEFNGAKLLQISLNNFKQIRLKLQNEENFRNYITKQNSKL